jgi:tight adherence protein B
MNVILFGIVIFVMSLLAIELSFHAVRIYQNPDRALVRKRLSRSLDDDAADEGDTSLLKKQILSDVPFLNHILSALPWFGRLQMTINQANMQYTLGFFILVSMTFGTVGYLAGWVVLKTIWQAIPIGIACTSLPYLHLLVKKKERMAKFEKQLPEALELIARALKAGHAFTSGMKLVAEEFKDPIGDEFDETLDEINFGLSVDDALKNLIKRVECIDLRFFVVAVILQRETGGNLAEIIESLAHLIRERFKFRGKVRVLSAEGKLSAAILVAVPFLLFAAIFVINPNYMETLILDPIGQTLSTISIIMMVIGIFIIRRIVDIDV